MKDNKDKSEIFKIIIENNKLFGISDDLIKKLNKFYEKAKDDISQIKSKTKTEKDVNIDIEIKSEAEADNLLETKTNSEFIFETDFNYSYENNLNGKIFSSHEGLLLKYEECFVRKLNEKYYNLSADFLWIGKFLNSGFLFLFLILIL
jgi:hypothetical protein